ncbi:hypothetical protein QJS10_CPB19g01030 [Acorus calamus]|uniref:Uncharacterized protein n=1 Tax=Acorus calamus TaxID=4465 RepID=A0AAV9CF62_ACOCL|nr:hypothetical protein QJS10_CPB19g01030 [Acorus calamus]
MPEARDRIEGAAVIARLPSDDKENITPEWARSGSRRRRTSAEWKSPLPTWYPRTPLRDITAIVNALERRTRVRASTLRRMNQVTETSQSNPPPATLESTISGQTTPTTETDLIEPTIPNSAVTPTPPVQADLKLKAKTVKAPPAAAPVAAYKRSTLMSMR